MATRWFSARAIRLHLTLSVLVPVCAALCVWQVHRALSGNTLSWAYVFEWPFFAGYGVYLWWRLLHDPSSALPGPTGPEGSAAGIPSAASEEPDEELAAYNRYLAELHTAGRPKRW